MKAKEARDKHCRERTCSKATFEEPSGITDEQQYAIRRLTGRGVRTVTEDLWPIVWNILFPDSPCPLHLFSIQQRPQDDVSGLTEADFRLPASGEFQPWKQSFPGVSSAGEDQRAEICKESIQTFSAGWLGQDKLLSQISRPENVKGATFNPPATTQEEPSELPQDSEFLGGPFGNSPSTSSVGSSPDSDTEPPLFASIRRILSADPSYAAEDVISAIEKQSGGKNFVLAGSGSEPAIIEDLISEAPTDQVSTSQGSKRRPTRTSGGSKSQANKKQKTCTPSDADGDDEDGGGGNGDKGGDDKGSGGDGGGGDGVPPRHTSNKSSENWICPYCLKHVEITCVKEFKSCRRPGFRKRSDLT